MNELYFIASLPWAIWSALEFSSGNFGGGVVFAGLTAACVVAAFWRVE
jgi:hypothetical protein